MKGPLAAHLVRVRVRVRVRVGVGVGVGVGVRVKVGYRVVRVGGHGDRDKLGEV